MLLVSSKGEGSLRGLLKKRATFGRQRVDVIENIYEERDRHRPKVFIFGNEELSRYRHLITDDVIKKRVTQCH
jgi:hypothetical protein